MIEVIIGDQLRQVFTSTLLSVNYDFEGSFNTRNSVWTINISSQGESIINGLSLVCGTERMKALPRIPITGMWLVPLVDNVDPTVANLYTDYKLVVLSEEEQEGLDAAV